MADAAALESVLAAVREHSGRTARRISDVARNPDGTMMDPGKVARLLRELEQRGLVEKWKRPGTRAKLWSAIG